MVIIIGEYFLNHLHFNTSPKYFRKSSIKFKYPFNQGRGVLFTFTNSRGKQLWDLVYNRPEMPYFYGSSSC